MTETKQAVPASPAFSVEQLQLRNAGTVRLLKDSGIKAGMRVIDIGCGTGDVSFLAAQLVGPTGLVIGLDRDAKALATAKDRARSSSDFQHIVFAEGDFSFKDFGSLALPKHISSEGPPLQFDAIVGRRVLMYQKDQVEALTKICSVLKAGGLVVLQEIDLGFLSGIPASLPLHRSLFNWVSQTVDREGANLHMGTELWSVFNRVGLQIDTIRVEAQLQHPKDGKEGGFPLATIVRVMLPRILEHKVATAEEIDIETLEGRLKTEREKAATSFVCDMQYFGWARKL